jgi:hypothetical protein
MRGLVSLKDPVRVDGSRLAVGSALEIHAAHAKRWRPPPYPPFDVKSIQRGLAVADTILPLLIPADGLASILYSAGSASPVVNAARAAVAYLGTLVSSNPQGGPGIDVERIVPLVGLGPGLTPSGDDYIGGTLIVLHAVGRDVLARTLWGAMAPIARVCTNDISFAHLSAAAEGYGTGALHALVNDLIAGGSRETGMRISEVGALGHTSGFDAIAGAVAALRIVAGRKSDAADLVSAAAHAASLPLARA